MKAEEIRASTAANYDTTDGREIHSALLEIAAQLAELNEHLRKHDRSELTVKETRLEAPMSTRTELERKRNYAPGFSHRGAGRRWWLKPWRFPEIFKKAAKP